MDVEVRFVNNQKGKGLFANKDFETGTVLFEEDPIVCCQFAWNEAFRYLACNHCMRPLETAQENSIRLSANQNIVLPHPECCVTNKEAIINCQMCGVQFCSKECYTTAVQQYHKTICLRSLERNMTHPLEKLTQAWKEMHFPPETCNIMLLVRMIAMVQQSPNPHEIYEMFMKFCHRTVNEDSDLAHKLVGEKFVEQINLLLDILRQAVPHDNVEQWLTPEGFRKMLALIGTNSQGVGTSAVSAWVKNCQNLSLEEGDREKLDKFINSLYDELDKESDIFLNNEGSALFALQSSCNHSCEPNVQPNFLHNNYRLSMVATRDIQAGEEILVSYLDECNLQRSRYTRQKILSENYLFMCSCSKCLAESGGPDMTSEEEMSDDSD